MTVTSSTPLLPSAGASGRDVARAVNAALNGKINAVQSLTLAANAGTTVLIDQRIAASSYLAFTPRTANAAAALATTYVAAQGKGQATIAHLNLAQTDRAFSVLIIG
ncbi:MAG TPA: hypothetical protein VHL08_04585 [Dongiaceae bacterium]|jgi:hypothetical protein|nr:hypothetical protein [Dongiaceae bacterium]